MRIAYKSPMTVASFELIISVGIRFTLCFVAIIIAPVPELGRPAGTIWSVKLPQRWDRFGRVRLLG